MIETKPERKVLFMCDCLRFADADLLDAQVVGGENLDADAVAVDELARFGNAAEPLADEAAHGGGFDILLEVKAGEEVGEAREVEIAGNDVAASSVLDDVAIGLVLVADFADDDLEQVLHGGEAGGVAVLVYDDDHVGALMLHLAHEVADGLGLGDEEDGADEVADGAVLALGLVDLEHVANVDKADDLVDVV